jgi:putative ABC transport system permease protein
MKKKQLIWNSLFHFWPVNLAMILGVIIGTASITGALIVGDSVRGSLRQMTLDRLGKVDFALKSHRFFREEILVSRNDANHSDSDLANLMKQAAPAISLTGSFEFHDKEIIHRASNIEIYGVDERFWKLANSGNIKSPKENQVVLNHQVAKELNLAVGDRVTLWIELPATIPRETLLGKKDENSREIQLTVSAILSEESGLGRFDLNPSQQLPAVAFVSLSNLQAQLDLAKTRNRRTKAVTPARINSLFFPTLKENKDPVQSAKLISEYLLKECLTLDDVRLKIVSNEKRGYFSIESEQQILETPLAERVISTAEGGYFSYSPVLVYLINEFSKKGSKETDQYSMYSTIAGINLENAPPFGPFIQSDGSPVKELKQDEVLINFWLAEDLKASVGDQLQLKYHQVGSDGDLPEEVRFLSVKSVLKMENSIANDRGFVPEVKGITDAETLGDWEQPFPMNFDRITSRDDSYWLEYKATPKAFISLELAQSWWNSRYGQLTSVRIAPRENNSMEKEIESFRQSLLHHLTLNESGLNILPVKYQGLQSASGTTDFSGLFIGFSFFLILSATILISLLFRLGLDQRLKSVGLLSALGFTNKQVQKLFFKEAIVILGIGSLIGIYASIGYSELIIYGLKTWWIGAIGTRFLNIHISPISLVMGLVITAAITSFALWRSLSSLKKFSARGLLLGNQLDEENSRHDQQSKRNTITISVCLVVIISLLTGSLLKLIPSTEAFSGISWQVVAFFLTGTSLLILSLSLLSRWLNNDSTANTGPLNHRSLLAFKNASRNSSRSVYTVALVASATFVIVAVAAGHRNPATETPELHSGNGGFTLVAESSVPILQNMNTKKGRGKLNLNQLSKFDQQDQKNSFEVVSFGMKPGENASCLNIYQTRLPTILGVPDSFVQRGGFKFADTPTNEPWKLLLKNNEDGSIPVLGDMNTLMYSLHKGIGATIPISAEDPSKGILKVEGMLDGSIFQGVLLMSQQNLRKLFPEQAGYQYFLIQSDLSDMDEISSLLESGLTEYGFDAEPVSQKLAAFLAVQNTYLSTFQTIGGFGLFLGTFGLAIVMMRNVLERKKELALMRCIGFRSGQLAKLILQENGLLLLWGLVSGTVAALLAMLPHLMSTGADLPWQSLLGTLIFLFIFGMISALASVYQAMKSPVIPALRSE